MQLGPVIRGTTLRDVQPFIDFTAYRDQIAFAELARALNDQAYKTALEAVPRDGLVGKTRVAGRGLHDEGGGRSGPDHAGQLRGGAVSEIGLSIRGAVKVYPGTRALDDVDFDVRMGAVNVLVGENGAGKSTLMKVIAGVEQLTAGEMLMDGKPVHFASTRGGGEARDRDRVPGAEPVPEPQRRRQHLHRARAYAGRHRHRRAPAAGGGAGADAAAGARHPAGDAGGRAADRAAADRRDRQGAGAGRADPDPRRADLGA